MADMAQGERKTPVWCSACEMWVPKEKEPHVHPDNRDPHYADGGVATPPPDEGLAARLEGTEG